MCSSAVHIYLTMFFMCFDKHCHVQLRILWEGEFVAKCLKCHVDWSIKRLKGSGHGTRARTHTHSHTHTHANTHPPVLPFPFSVCMRECVREFV